MRSGMKIAMVSAVAIALSATAVKAQVSIYDVDRHGSIYLNIGSFTPSFSGSTIHVKQGSLNNDYNLENLTADENTNKSSSIPSFRLGFFFNNNQDLALELSYDPVNYHVIDGQVVAQKGTVTGTDVDKTMKFSVANGYYYNLSGANQVLINIVKRFGLYKNEKHTFYLDALAKVGVGPLMPAVSNSIDGKVMDNPGGFQISGWNAGFEAGIRATIYKHVYLEGAWKYDRASYTSVNINSGTADQKLTTTGFIFSIGGTLSTTKRNPRFDKVQKKRHILTIGSMNMGNVD
jgi:hypothetical protein